MKKKADVPKLPTAPLAAMRAALKALGSIRCKTPAFRWPPAADAAMAKLRSAIAGLKGATEAPVEIPGLVELFPPTAFLAKPIVPKPELADCLTNPLEIDGPPAGRAALIERLLSLSNPPKTKPRP